MAFVIFSNFYSYFEMSDGIDFVPIAMGLFGIAEIMSNREQRTHAHSVTPISSLWPSREA